MQTLRFWRRVQSMLKLSHDSCQKTDYVSLQSLPTKRSFSMKRDLLNYDVIVVGLGSTGCAVLQQLARKGLKVLGIEKSSQVCWSGYPVSAFDFHCRPQYYRILDRSINLWHRLEDATEKEFVKITGSLYCGVFYDEIYDAISDFGFDHEELRGFKALRRFPQLSIPEREDLLYIDNAGVIDKTEAISSLFSTALDNGAKTRFNEEVHHWESTGDLVEVMTEQCCYHCKTLVLCCGGHSVYSLLPELQNVVTKTTETIFEYQLDWKFDALGVSQVPVFHYDINESHEVVFWSSPISDTSVYFTLKYPRDVTVDISEGLSDYEEAVWDEIAFNVCPGIERETPRTHWTQCSTGIVDGHFILDWHPASQQVIIALADGELGFHCAPAVAEIVSFMVTDKSHAKKILSPFSLFRDSLRSKIPGPFLSGARHTFPEHMQCFYEA